MDLQDLKKAIDSGKTVVLYDRDISSLFPVPAPQNIDEKILEIMIGRYTPNPIIPGNLESFCQENGYLYSHDKFERKHYFQVMKSKGDITYVSKTYP